MIPLADLYRDADLASISFENTKSLARYLERRMTECTRFRCFGQCHTERAHTFQCWREGGLHTLSYHVFIRQRIRPWLPAVSMLLVSLISYIDRNALALLAPTILRETKLSAEQYGYVVSAFSLAYTAANPLWGVILDRYGLRLGMAAAVSLWTFASGAHAFATGFWSFALARAVLGFGEGATFPGGLRTATQTLPARVQSRGIAIAYSGGSLGAIVTPLIVTPVALSYGWRGAFFFTGAIGLLWLAFWAGISGRLPPHRRSVPASSAAGIRLRDPRLWAFIAAYALGALPLAFVIYGAAVYLGDVRRLSQADIGRLLWIPPLGWEMGYFFWGWVADRSGPVRSLRGMGLLGALAVLSLTLAGAPYLQNTVALMTAMLFAMFVASGFIILSLRYATDAFGSSGSGLIAGIGAGSWSAAVAVFMPAIGKMFDRGQYEEAFTVAAGTPVLGFLLWGTLELQSRRMQSRQR